MAQSFTCENLHSYLFWIHTHCTCIKLYELPLDQKTGLQKKDIKPQWNLPPPFFPSQTSSVSKERVNQVLVRKIFDVESEFQCTDLSTRAVVYNPSKFTTSHSKKNIYPGTLSRSQSLWMICGFGWVIGEMLGCVLSCRSKVRQRVHWWEIEGPDRTSFTYFQIKKNKLFYTLPSTRVSCVDNSQGINHLYSLT